MSDPLSITASVTGVLGVAAQISLILFDFIERIKDAPPVVNALLTEIHAIRLAMGHLEEFLHGSNEIDYEGGSLVLIDHLRLILTDCVCTFSSVESMVNGLPDITDISALQLVSRVEWVIKENRFWLHLKRLERQKSFLLLMLHTLEGKSTQESFVVIWKLNRAVDSLITSNEDLVRRLESREWVSGRQPSSSVPTSASLNSRPASSAEIHSTRSISEAALSLTRLCKRARWLADKDSDSSRIRASFFSELAFFQVSNFSLYALPIFPHELTNPKWYVEEISQSPKEEAVQALTNVASDLRRNTLANEAQRPKELVGSMSTRRNTETKGSVDSGICTPELAGTTNISDTSDLTVQDSNNSRVYEEGLNDTANLLDMGDPTQDIINSEQQYTYDLLTAQTQDFISSEQQYSHDQEATQTIMSCFETATVATSAYECQDSEW